MILTAFSSMCPNNFLGKGYHCYTNNWDDIAHVLTLPISYALIVGVAIGVILLVLKKS